MRATLSIILALTIAAAGLAAKRPTVVQARPDIRAARVIAADNPAPNPRHITAPTPVPRRDEVIGELYPAGDTYYDYQTNGTVGKMIAVDNQGGVHVTWMDGYDAAERDRHQKYNFFENGAFQLGEDGGAVDVGTRSGYGSICLTTEEEQRAIIFCHVSQEQGGANAAWAVGVDYGRGYGAFQFGDPPVFVSAKVLWPQGVMSPEGVIHVVGNRADAGQIAYTHGTIGQDGIPVFDQDYASAVDSSHLNSFRIAHSPNSERVAITWLVPRNGIPAPPEWDGFLAYQLDNDLYLAISEDGVNWDFDHPINVTRCIPPNPQEEDTLKAVGDTLRPYCTHDIIFDANDNVHVVFDTRGIWLKPVYDPATDRPPVKGLTLDAGYLFQWNEETDSITAVADGWFSQQVLNDTRDTLIIWPTPGAWKTNVCSPSLAYAENGDLYCVYNYYPWGDYNDYVDQGANSWDVGRCNGDIAITVSEDNGLTWYYPTMIVNTPSPLANAGEAMCEDYPTLADRIDDTLHIFYELDTEAGTSVGQSESGASNTLCPFYYLKVPVDSVRRDSIWTGGPAFHVGPVAGNNSAPASDAWRTNGFNLTAAYPNPFNSRTSVEFTLKETRNVRLTAHSVDGRQVAELYSGSALSGEHRVTWDASGLPAGIYLIQLSDGHARSVMKTALVK